MFLTSIGVELTVCEEGRYRWKSKPLDSSLPVDRFSSLKHANRFWRGQCISRLRDIYQIEQLIAVSHPLSSADYSSIVAWLDFCAEPYPPCFQTAATKIRPFTPPRNWKRLIMNLASKHGAFHEPWLKDLHRRTLVAHGYTDALFLIKEPTGLVSNGRSQPNGVD